MCRLWIATFSIAFFYLTNIIPHKKKLLYLLDHKVRQDTYEVHLGSATQKGKASNNKQRRQRPDTKDISDCSCIYAEYGKNLGKWMTYVAMNQSKISNIVEYINIGEIADMIFTFSEHG